jgi:heme a synthase
VSGMRILLSITAGLTYLLIVFGGTVRVYGAGLACPDWPLCHGKIIPPFDFLVLLEWGHRLVAAIVGFLTLAIAVRVWTNRAYRERVGVIALNALLLVIVQAGLGGLTVLERLHFSTVTLHLITGLLFLATLLWMLMRLSGRAYESFPGQQGMTWALGLTCLAFFTQSLLGGLVSSNYAGLACPDFPTCYGEWFPTLSGTIGLQMVHRFGAYLVTLLMTGLVIFAWRNPMDRKLRLSLSLLYVGVLCQLGLGIGSVVMGFLPWMRIAHLALATALIAMMVVTWYKVQHARVS